MAGFDPGQQAVVVSTGVTMYLGKDTPPEMMSRASDAGFKDARHVLATT